MSTGCRVGEPKPVPIPGAKFEVPKPDPTGNAYLVGTGPGLDAYKWDLSPEDYVLAVNFAGISCPRYNAFVALDTHRAGIFDDVYPADTVCYVMRPRTAMRRFFNCQMFKHYLPGSGCSSGAFGVCVLAWIGYKKITAIGFDARFTGKHSHAQSLIKKGLYSSVEHGASKVLEDAVNNTIKKVSGLEVLFWNPSGDHQVLCSEHPSKP